MPLASNTSRNICKKTSIHQCNLIISKRRKLCISNELLNPVIHKEKKARKDQTSHQNEEVDGYLSKSCKIRRKYLTNLISTLGTGQ